MTAESNRDPTPARPWLSRPAILAAIAVVVLVGLRLLPVVAQALLVIFGAVVVAALLDGVSTWLSQHTPLSRPVALSLFLFLCLVLGALTLWLTGQGLSNQFDELTERISEGIERLNQALQNIPWARNFMNEGGISGGGLFGSELWGRVGGVFSTAFGAIANGLILLVTAMQDRMTGRSRGFGFVTMSNDQEAEKAISGLNGAELRGRALTVNVARPREERSSGSGQRQFQVGGRSRY